MTPRRMDPVTTRETARRVTHVTGSTMGEMPLTIRCGLCKWEAIGEPSVVLEERAAHVARKHPNLPKPRGRRGMMGRWGQTDSVFKLPAEVAARGRAAGAQAVEDRRLGADRGA